MLESDWEVRDEEENDDDETENDDDDTEDEGRDGDESDFHDKWIYCYPGSDVYLSNVTWYWECYTQDGWTPYSVCEERMLEQVNSTLSSSSDLES